MIFTKSMDVFKCAMCGLIASLKSRLGANKSMSISMDESFYSLIFQRLKDNVFDTMYFSDVNCGIYIFHRSVESCLPAGT